eukprot:8449889-Pyramimonas_sp.AAC.1
MHHWLTPQTLSLTTRGPLDSLPGQPCLLARRCRHRCSTCWPSVIAPFLGRGLLLSFITSIASSTGRGLGG